MSKSTLSPRSRKRSIPRPKKPYPAFPLSPHPVGKWQKKINGKVKYFGRWARMVEGKLVPVEGDGWQEALAIYNAQRADLEAGRKPREKPADDALTVKALCNEFRTAKLKKLESKSRPIGQRMYDEYVATCDMLVKFFGDRRVDDLTAKDFEQLREMMQDRWGPVRLGNEIGKVKTVFKYGRSIGLIRFDLDHLYGEFQKPSALELRKHRAENGSKMLEPAEIKKLLDAAPSQLKAMILLGLNCGFGNHDCALLRLDKLDLEGGWIDYARPKTGVKRRCPLWPETIAALKEAIAARPKVRQEGADGFVFITAQGRQWLSRGIAHPVTACIGGLMRDVGIHRPRLGMYALRHVFATVASGSRDPVAIDTIMGHAPHANDMAAVYREHIEDSRLRAVADHVRAWLFPAPAKEGGAR